MRYDQVYSVKFSTLLMLPQEPTLPPQTVSRSQRTQVQKIFPHSCPLSLPLLLPPFPFPSSFSFLLSLFLLPLTLPLPLPVPLPLHLPSPPVILSHFPFPLLHSLHFFSHNYCAAAPHFTGFYLAKTLLQAVHLQKSLFYRKKVTCVVYSKFQKKLNSKYNLHRQPSFLVWI